MFSDRSVLDCEQSLSEWLRGGAHSAARLERGKIAKIRSLQFFFFSRLAISRDLSTIQKGTACSLVQCPFKRISV